LWTGTEQDSGQGLNPDYSVREFAEDVKRMGSSMLWYFNPLSGRSGEIALSLAASNTEHFFSEFATPS